MEPEAPSSVPKPIDATNPSPLKQIRTYQGDVAEALRGQNESLVSIRAQEKARAELIEKAAPSPAEEPKPKRNWTTPILLVTSLILLGAAGTGTWFSYNTYKQKTAVPVSVVPDNRFLPVAATDDVDAASITKDALASLAASEAGKPLADGNVRQIELRKGSGLTSPLLTSTELLLALETKAPGGLVRAFDRLFMFGVLGQPASSTPAAAPFLLVKLDSYENAYAGMLAWEENLKEDLLPLFVPPAELGNVSAQAAFADETLKNKDVRVLRDVNSKSVLVYSFYNQSLLVVTTNEDALKTLIAELDTQTLKR